MSLLLTIAGLTCAALLVLVWCIFRVGAEADELERERMGDWPQVPREGR